MANPTVTHDTSPDVPEGIVAYTHCRRCLEELEELSEPQSPREWSRLQVGITDKGHIQVVCTRHDLNVDLMRVNDKADEDTFPSLCQTCGFQTKMSRDMNAHVDDTGHEATFWEPAV